ncbi:ring-hydroxylating dioxygenase subunit beta [Prauserella sp. PE36]|uniref:Ring-hydroxylating dioxygenase subunit beta n=1 Tax=Prauserella endophytica TaxID=1592324 RepID=A0ABY2RYS8_9PSEU|nr:MULTISPECIES: aromatic-ring-hydroxylating dioxygenase subunit beta [Prauserella]PXY33517.1 ring-hydroxylating dioxygenase subunit beta [Prauserella coralliicola]RBM21715.1 ring-hydroxylating dioxygenase subunit beta [Prauserella sp. PE36]TKG65769.1 ring-hydroxylating dioxygenase subunit beta [Prauserella endophytica]
MTAPANAITLADAEQFLYREARLADEGRYDEWEALWTDDALYWVPVADSTDTDERISIICDHRSRIALRVAQLKTGKRHSQDPRSAVARLISNIEIVGHDTDGTRTQATFVAVESRARGITIWAGRVEHTLVQDNDRILMSRKQVRLVNADQPLPTLAFLI